MEGQFLGTISYFTFDWVPQGWLPCDGQLLDKDTYSALYSLLSNMYGGNDTQFALPDLRGRTMVAAGTVPIGTQMGADRLSLTIDMFAPHTHNFSFSIPVSNISATDGVPTDSTVLASTSNNIYSNNPSFNTYAKQITTVAPAGGSAPINLMNPYVALTPCICTLGPYPTTGN